MAGAYERLRDEIIDWQLPPGTPLKEEEVALRLGMSRTPVREALARLRRDRLVVQEPGSVAAVAPVGLSEVVQMFQVRDALEVRAVELCALAPHREPFADLAAAYRTCMAGGGTDIEDGLVLGDRFEELIDRTAANPFLADPLQQLRVGLRRLRRISRSNPARWTTALHERAEVAEAIAAGDAPRAAHAEHARLQASLESTLLTLQRDLGALSVTAALDSTLLAPGRSGP